MYKRPLAIFTLIIFAFSCNSKQKIVSPNQANNQVALIDSLINSKSYFLAKHHMGQPRMSPYNALRFRAILQSVFNQPQISNESITVLFNSYNAEMDAGTKRDLLLLELSNYVNLFDYAGADSISQIITNEYQAVLSSQLFNDIQNNGRIWKALRDCEPQEIYIPENTSLPLIKDRAELNNLIVKTDNQEYRFIFDTGANFSVMSASQAKKSGLKFANTTVQVMAITGEKVEARPGVLPAFNLDNIEVKNAVFLVFPDEALYVPVIDYQINGILGFPVIAGLKEIHFSADELFIPKSPEMNGESNLAIEFLTPIINLNYQSHEMHFSFDTGADQTMLYKPFFNTDSARFKSNHDLKTVSYGGVGSKISEQGYYVDVELDSRGKTARLESVPLLLKTANGFYGNIGQDFISQFDKMILNFESMFVRFE